MPFETAHLNAVAFLGNIAPHILTRLQALALQAALDVVQTFCTTVVVAHRLSTIRNADSIAVLQVGSRLHKAGQKKNCSLQARQADWNAAYRDVYGGGIKATKVE